MAVYEIKKNGEVVNFRASQTYTTYRVGDSLRVKKAKGKNPKMTAIFAVKKYGYYRAQDLAVKADAEILSTIFEAERYRWGFMEFIRTADLRVKGLVKSTRVRVTIDYSNIEGRFKIPAIKATKKLSSFGLYGPPIRIKNQIYQLGPEEIEEVLIELLQKEIRIEDIRVSFDVQSAGKNEFLIINVEYNKE